LPRLSTRISFDKDPVLAYSARALKFPALLTLLCAALLISLGAGPVRYTITEILSVIGSRFKPGGGSAGVSSAAVTIIWDLRLSRSILAAVVGAALAMSGAAFQGLFRNPLADPFVIGASSGAALGAALAIALHIVIPVAGLSAVPAAAFAGSLLSVLLVYALSSAGTASPPTISLLLAGTALSSLLSAMVSFIMAMRDNDLHQVFFWLLGGFGGSNWNHLVSILPYIIPGAAILLLLARPLDVLAFGEESAKTMGVSITTTRLLAVGAASLTTAAAVAVSGIIGFIGLLAPHAARLIFGPSHRTLMPASALIGAVLLVLADICARTVLAPVELPVGILTAMLGAPFFLFLLRTRREGLGGGA
jgi:iron complex transport system permease protein